MSRAAGAAGLGVIGAASLVFSNMVGSGIFTTSGFLLESLGSPLLMLGVWLAGGLLALAGAASYGELGASLPQVGGDYIYLRKAYGPLWAFLSGWMSFFAGFGAPIALTAIGFTEYITPLAPWLSTQGHEPLFTVGSFTPTVSPGHLGAIAVIWLLTLVHYTGIRISGRVQVSVTVVNVLLILGFLAAAFASPAGDWSRLQTPAGGPGSLFANLDSVAVALIMVLFAYTGFNAAAYVAGELRNPGRDLPKALLGGSAVVLVLYLALNVVYIYAVPPAALAGRIDVARLAAERLIGPALGGMFSIVVGICVLACCSAMVCIAPRVYYMMGRDGVFFRAAGRKSARFGTPGAAMVLQAVWASLLVVLGTFSQLLTYCGFMLSLFSSLTVASLFVLRKRFPGLERPYRVWGYPFTPAAYLAVSLWMMIWAIGSQALESAGGILIVAAGVPVYYYWRKKNRDVSRPESR